MPYSQFIRPRARRWVPSDLRSSLAAWFDASDLNTIIMNGGNVAQWRDKSLNGNHVLQSTATLQPLYVPGVLGTANLPNVQYSGSTPVQGLTTSGNARVPTGTSPRQIFCLFLIRSASTAGGFVSWGDRNAGTTGTSFAHFFGTSYDSWVSTNNSDLRSGPGVIANQNYITASTLQNQSGVIRKNGAQVASGGLNFNTGQGTLSVGDPNWTSPPDPNYQAGSVSLYELGIVYGAQVDPQILEGYLAWKWGVQALLASTHMYRYRPPMITV